MITVNLVTKCCLIGGAGAATGAGAYYIKESYFSNDKKLEALAKNVGLVCKGNPTETKGTVCTKNGTVNFKKEETNIAVTSPWTSGKITVYTTSSEGEYKDGFKFVIEDGDISGSAENKKIEQFETYEINEDAGDWKLIRKNDAKTEIKKALGLPEDNTCNFPTDSSTDAVECALDEAKLKKVKFEGLVDGEVNINSGSPKLKISKVGGSDYGTAGYKFVLESTQDINFPNAVTIKKGTNTEFKIKRENGSLTLEKAWSIEELAKKVGLVCPVGDKKECTLGADKINVDNGDNKKHSELTKKEDTGNKIVKYEENVGDHNQGIKFFTEEANGIELQGGAGSDTGSKKIEAKTNDNGIFYEIKKDNDGKWYLTKKAAAA